MKLTDQVISKDQAIQLKKLGVRGESLFYWAGDGVVSGKELVDEFAEQLLDNAVEESNGSLTYDKDKLQDSARKAFELGYSAEGYPELEFEMCNAFTVGELGIMLPTLGISTIKSSGSDGDFFWCQCHYLNKHETQSKNEAEARAEMLIWIIEKKHNACAIDEVNQRLAQ